MSTKGASWFRHLGWWLVSLLFAAFVSACVGQGRAALVITARPPPSRHVVVVDRPGWVWIEGRWAWSDGRWRWNNGYWVRERPTYVYVQGRWVRSGNGYVWVSGHWRVRGRYEHSRYVRGYR